MSRIGKKPIDIVDKVKVMVGQSGVVTVEGPIGKMSETFRPLAKVRLSDSGKQILVERVDDSPLAKAYHGTVRALIANMVEGVSKGFQKNLSIEGVGYNAKLQGQELVLQVGYCHPVNLKIPVGLKVLTPKPTRIEISGYNKQVVGEFAAVVRRVRPPEPYKGKGIRFEDERVVRKAGKAFGSGA